MFIENREPLVDIVILHWRHWPNTVNCLYSLNFQTYSKFEIVLINNGDKERRDFHQICRKPLHYIENPINLGVAKGRNLGIRYALDRGTDYILFLDNDVVAHPDLLIELVKGAQGQAEAGIVGPKIYLKKEGERGAFSSLSTERESQGHKSSRGFLLQGTQIIWRAGCPSWRLFYLHSIPYWLQFFWQLSGHQGPQTWLDLSRGQGQTDRGQYDSIDEVDFLIGCCQLIKRGVFERVGFLDEGFSPYGGEDIDFCHRAKQAGYRLFYLPRALIWHCQESSFTEEFDRTYFNNSHILRLARKNLSNLYFWGLFVPDFIFCSIPMKIVDSLWKRRLDKLEALGRSVWWHLQNPVNF